jgi:predicted O-methyltransferase YrrM
MTRNNETTLKKFTLDEISQIAGFGRSTDPSNPLSRQDGRELLWLINEKLLDLNPQNILEIGVASGGTSLILSTIFKNSSVVGMDLTDALLPNQLRAMSNFQMIIGNSNDHATRDFLVETTGIEKFDFILIDGDHSESGVLGDYELYIPMLREGGLACFHDVRLDPPKGIKPTWYGRLKGLMPGSEEYFVSPENTGFGYWIKNSS